MDDDGAAAHRILKGCGGGEITRGQLHAGVGERPGPRRIPDERADPRTLTAEAARQGTADEPSGAGDENAPIMPR